MLANQKAMKYEEEARKQPDVLADSPQTQHQQPPQAVVANAAAAPAVPAVPTVPIVPAVPAAANVPSGTSILLYFIHSLNS